VWVAAFIVTLENLVKIDTLSCPADAVAKQGVAGAVCKIYDVITDVIRVWIHYPRGALI